MSHTICERRVASPSTPISWRMMSCIALIVDGVNIFLLGVHYVEKFVDHFEITVFATKQRDEFIVSAKRTEWLECEDANTFYVFERYVRVFLEKCFYHLASFTAVLVEII